jgi:uncharacterized protein YdiU (UPF0061 family)
MPISPSYCAETIHSGLGDEFYDAVAAAEFPKHIIRHRNARSAARVGLETLTETEWIAHFGKFQPLPGSFPQPLALRYHGHQFRHYNHELGDGRGFLFAQLRDVADGRLLDLGTKGSGQTPWSRRGDGRLTLKGGVREVLATEMLEALGVDTSKSFSLIETGENLVRGDEPSPTRSSVLTRLSHSHIRIGTFQRLAYFDDKGSIARLLEHCIAHYLPMLADVPAERRAPEFLAEVSRRVAKLGAQWMVAGFVHGVLNSDNINITGESFDYGPWRFAPHYDPQFTAAYFDENGLYSFGRQPSALAWNLTRLAECLIPISDKVELEKALDVFEPTLQREFALALLRRLGLKTVDQKSDAQLAKVVLEFLGKTKAPYERFFFDWRGGAASLARAAASPSADHYATAEFAAVLQAFGEHETAEDANLDHAYFQRLEPCGMLIDEVEAIWAPIAASDDWSIFHAKLAAIDQMREAYAPVGVTA